MQVLTCPGAAQLCRLARGAARKIVVATRPPDADAISLPSSFINVSSLAGRRTCAKWRGLCGVCFALASLPDCAVSETECPAEVSAAMQ